MADILRRTEHGRREVRWTVLCTIALFVAATDATHATHATDDLCGPPFFGSLRAPGPGHMDAAVADLDGDGLDDIVTANNDVYIQFNRDGVSFDAPIVFDLGVLPAGAVDALDVDGDGDPDLIVHLSDEPVFIVYRNDGTGTFSGPPEFHGINFLPKWRRWADIDADGDLDYIITEDGSGTTVAVYRNPGDGFFEAPDLYGLTGGAFHIAIGDFTGNGLPDIATITSTGLGLDLLPNEGGTFGPPESPVLVPSGAIRLAGGDFNEDGQDDIAIVFYGSPFVQIALSDGFGGFAHVPVLHPLPGLLMPREIVATDFDGDGDIDLGAWSQGETYADEYAVLLNDADGGWTATVPQALPENMSQVHVATVGGTGTPDVIAVKAGRVYALLDPGVRRTNVRLQGTDDVSAACVADLNGDGRPEVIAAMETAVAVFPNLGDDGFGAAQLVFDPGFAPFAVVSLDLDADGDNDVVTGAGGNVHVFSNSGDATLSPPLVLPTGVESHRLVPGDLDGDGDVDLAVAIRDGSDGGLARLVNDGAGGLSFEILVLDTGTTRDIALADIDADGDLDLAVAFDELGVNDTIRLYRNDGAGGFDEETVETLLSPKAVWFADMDADADLDLVVGAVGMSWFENDGAGVFTHVQTIDGVGQPGAVVDVDHDGDADFIGGATEVYVTTAEDGQLTEQTQYYAGGAFRAAADIDGDGAPEVLASNGPVVTITWGRCADAPSCPGDFDGAGSIDFGDLVFLVSAWGPCPGCAADLNGNGSVDFADLVLLLSVWGDCPQGRE